MPWWGWLIVRWLLAALVVALLFAGMIRLRDRRTPCRPPDDEDPSDDGC